MFDRDAYNKSYQEANKERIQRQRQAYRDANRKLLAAKNKVYREENKEVLSQKAKESHALNRGHRVERMRNYYDAHKEQQRMYRKTKAYGISKDKWEALFEKQNGKCPICKTELGRDRNTHVDHCHNTGRIRGLLCSHCNTGLGNFFDDKDILLQAVEYLKEV